MLGILLSNISENYLLNERASERTNELARAMMKYVHIQRQNEEKFPRLYDYTYRKRQGKSPDLFLFLLHNFKKKTTTHDDGDCCCCCGFVAI